MQINNVEEFKDNVNVGDMIYYVTTHCGKPNSIEELTVIEIQVNQVKIKYNRVELIETRIIEDFFNGLKRVFTSYEEANSYYEKALKTFNESKEWKMIIKKGCREYPQYHMKNLITNPNFEK